MEIIGILLATALTASAGFVDDRPNIIFFADDYSFYDTGAYGNDEVQTPNLDHLAQQGTLISHTYNMGSWSPAACIPSRTMLQTGMTVWNTRQYDVDQWIEGGKF